MWINTFLKNDNTNAILLGLMRLNRSNPFITSLPRLLPLLPSMLMCNITGLKSQTVIVSSLLSQCQVIVIFIMKSEKSLFLVGCVFFLFLLLYFFSSLLSRCRPLMPPSSAQLLSETFEGGSSCPPLRDAHWPKHTETRNRAIRMISATDSQPSWATFTCRLPCVTL